MIVSTDEGVVENIFRAESGCVIEKGSYHATINRQMTLGSGSNLKSRLPDGKSRSEAICG